MNLIREADADLPLVLDSY